MGAAESRLILPTRTSKKLKEGGGKKGGNRLKKGGAQSGNWEMPLGVGKGDKITSIRPALGGKGIH